MLKNTPSYLQRRPPNVAKSLRWPTTDQIASSLAEMARLKWPSVAQLASSFQGTC